MSSLARRTAPPGLGIGLAVPAVARTSNLLAFIVTGAALVVAILAIRPTLGPPLAYDTFASVLHFERLVNGRHLESALGTTPKPLLTLALGLAYSLGGWVLVSLVSIVVWAAAVGLATALATRLAGIAGGAALGALLVASPALLLETAWGLASSWALGLWFAAALATFAPRPRWGLVGLLLGLATLARLETLLLVGLALGAVVIRAMLRSGGIRHLRQWRRGRPGLPGFVPPGPWRIALALWALPVMLIHDALLTGDPLYWLRVSEAYGRALASVRALPDAASAMRLVAGVPIGLPVISGLAIVGVLALVRRRVWPILLALVALGPGMGAFIVALAASGRFADPRYLVPVQTVILVAAAIGIGTLASLAVAEDGRARQDGRRAKAPAGRVASTWRAGVVAGALVVLGVGTALITSPAIGPLDASTQATLDRFHALARSADVAKPVLLHELDGFTVARRWPGTVALGDRTRSDIFSVPGNIRPRLALDLDAPLTRLVATDATQLDPALGNPPVGQVVLHSGGDLPAAPFAVFQIDNPTRAGPVILVPLLHDEAAATWVVRVDTSMGFNRQNTQSQR